MVYLPRSTELRGAARAQPSSRPSLNNALGVPSAPTGAQTGDPFTAGGSGPVAPL